LALRLRSPSWRYDRLRGSVAALSVSAALAAASLLSVDAAQA
jgi:hypothetical protein